MIKINNINTNLLKRKLKLTILTTTLIIGITGCRNKQPQTYTTTNGDVNVTNEITNYVINNVTEYNAVKNEKIPFYDDKVIFYNSDTGEAVGYVPPLELKSLSQQIRLASNSLSILRVVL